MPSASMTTKGKTNGYRMPYVVAVRSRGLPGAERSRQIMILTGTFWTPCKLHVHQRSHSSVNEDFRKQFICLFK
jgi:hypothetical protein